MNDHEALIDFTNATKDIVMHVRVTGVWRWRVSILLLKLAAKIGGFTAVVERETQSGFKIIAHSFRCSDATNETLS